MATRREIEEAVEALDDKILRVEDYLVSLVRQRKKLRRQLEE